MNYLKLPTLVFLLGLLAFACQDNKEEQQSMEAMPLSFESPNQSLRFEWDTSNGLTYSLYAGQALLTGPNPLQIATQAKAEVLQTLPAAKVEEKTESVNHPFDNQGEVKSNFTAVSYELGDFELRIRLYDDALAYRWVNTSGQTQTITEETIAYQIPKPVQQLYKHRSPGLDNSNESTYSLYDEPKNDTLYSPSLILKDQYFLLISDADLSGYPSQNHLHKNSDTTLAITAVLPNMPKEEKVVNNGYNFMPTQRGNHLAELSAGQATPWRLIQVHDSPEKLAGSTVISRLNPKPESDFSWVKPGKSTWDWYTKWNLDGVDFEPKMGNPYYLFQIEQAAKHGIKYVVIDDGWSELDDLLARKGTVDFQTLGQAAEEKGVGLMVWATYHALHKDIDSIYKEFSAYPGIAGFKVDFVDRSDAKAWGAMETIARKAAENKFVIDFHGVPVTAGLHLKYPNIVNWEAVMGNEFNKFRPEFEITATHTTTLPFCRGIMGPMDFTPAGMNSFPLSKPFETVHHAPYTYTTRCHQMAMYVVYDMPVSMLSDKLTDYLKEPELLQFVVETPEQWDETRVLSAKLGGHLVKARRKGDTWYIGGMANEEGFETTLDLKALGLSENTKLSLLQDGELGNEKPNSFRLGEVDYQASFPIKMAKAGGFVLKAAPMK